MRAAVRPLARVRVRVDLQLLQTVEGLLTQLTREVLPRFPLHPPLPRPAALCRGGAVVRSYGRHGNLAAAGHVVDACDVSRRWRSEKVQIFSTAETQRPTGDTENDALRSRNGILNFTLQASHLTDKNIHIPHYKTHKITMTKSYQCGPKNYKRCHQGWKMCMSQWFNTSQVMYSQRFKFVTILDKERKKRKTDFFLTECSWISI